MENSDRIVNRVEATLTGFTPIGLVPEGLRMDVTFAGEVVEGPLQGSKVSGVDYLLLRRDGIGVIEVNETITTRSGSRIAGRVHGYVTPPDGYQLPALEVILTPTFAWPDRDFRLHGVRLYRTGDADLAWMNRTAFSFEGTANMVTGVLRLTIQGHRPLVATRNWAN